MSEKKDNIIFLLNQLGVSDEEASIYLDILQGRGDTALALSRSSHLKRTKVYRLLDNLIEKGLIVNRMGERGGRFVVSPIDSLNFLVAQKESELKKLQKALPVLQRELSGLESVGSAQPQVLYFHGIEGLKQVTYNSLRARGELLTCELSTMNAFIDRDEAEKLRRRFVANNIYVRTLTNAVSIDAWTDVTDMVLHNWEIRHLDPRSSPFQFEILIYNDVYCMYRYVGNDIFCIEIHSQELADMQRQLFEYLWVVGKKFKVVDSHGTAKLA